MSETGSFFPLSEMGALFKADEMGANVLDAMVQAKKEVTPPSKGGAPKAAGAHPPKLH